MSKFESAFRSLIAPQEAPVLQEEVEHVIETVKNPPPSAIEYAQSVVQMYEELQELPSAKSENSDNDDSSTPAELALKTLISGGNVPATIGLLHAENADIPTRFELGVEAFNKHLELLTSEDEAFRDLQQARVAEHQLAVFQQAKDAVVSPESAFQQEADFIQNSRLGTLSEYPVPAGE